MRGRRHAPGERAAKLAYYSTRTPATKSQVIEALRWIRSVTGDAEFRECLDGAIGEFAELGPHDPIDPDFIDRMDWVRDDLLRKGH